MADASDHTDAARVDRYPWVVLAAFIGLSFLAGGVGNLLQGGDVGARYLLLDRPAWAPPSWAFGVVWPVLYVAIAVAGWRTWRAAGGLRPAAVALGLWSAQLLVNAVWPGVFFGLEAFGPAIAVIALLDVAVIATIAAMARIDRIAAWLLVPYLVWILYATALNTSIWALN